MYSPLHERDSPIALGTPTRTVVGLLGVSFTLVAMAFGLLTREKKVVLIVPWGTGGAARRPAAGLSVTFSAGSPVGDFRPLS